MSHSVTMAHKGWFGICPIYIGDMPDGAPLLLERRRYFLPLMMFSEWMFAACFFVLSALDPSRELAWPVRVTGEIEQWTIELPS